jgi:polyphosphate kinase
MASDASDKSLLRCMQNRELSWLRFNERVLEEAGGADTPLFERLFFLSVFTTNLDEFFMVRVGSFQALAQSGADYVDNKTGMSATEVLERVFSAVALLYPAVGGAYARLEAELAREGIPRRRIGDLNAETEAAMREYYRAQIEPVLAPQIVDKTHPFPHIENKRLIVAVWLSAKKDEKTFGMIPLPREAERLWRTADGGYVLTEDIILHYCDQIFKKHSVDEKAVVCVTRNADIDTVDERIEDDEDFRDHISKLLKRQKRLSPVRLEIGSHDCTQLANYLRKKLRLTQEQVFCADVPLDLCWHDALRETAPPHLRSKLSFTPFEPAETFSSSAHESMMQRIRKGDMLLSLPFESLSPFLALIKEAAEDSRVTSIRITLYRLAERSRLADTLIAAAENGKEVSVFIELRARMDEENNISHAKRLEEAGCSVFYGHMGYKMHAKICLITRSEGGRHEFFTHIGTGNFNEKTAKLYTDLAIITANRETARSAALFFRNMMTGALNESYPTFWVAPRDFKHKLIENINGEANLGDKGRIIIKCNSLTDRDVIAALAHASGAGTKIDLIIRGICCLLPGIHGMTDNIRVRSIVGRFLEHSRIYMFGGGDDAALYIGSGDMMTRNTERRTELFTPVFDEGIRARLIGMLDVLLRDNIKARILTPDGIYIPAKQDEDTPPLDSQIFFAEEAAAAARARVDEAQTKYGLFGAAPAGTGKRSTRVGTEQSALHSLFRRIFRR